MTMLVIMKRCDSCGSEHMGPVPCGMTFAQRMRTTKVDWAALETKDLHNYYDTAAVEAQFGHDATDRLYDESDGIGYTRQAADGDWYYRNRKTREVEKLNERQMEVLAGSQNEST